MKILKGKTAVVTGAGSGIGYALAERCAREGMNLVLADIEAESLGKSSETLKALGAKVVSLVCDVANPDDLDRLRSRTLQEYGAVHLLFNNAGVSAGNEIWETTLSDWEWVLGVNFRGVLNGIRSFVPQMIDQGEPAHIVNTASVGGLVSYHPSATYQVSKHAVVALSEHLYHSLNLKRLPIGVSILCPGWVQTRILEAERNRPDKNQASRHSPEEDIVRESFQRSVAGGMTAEEIARITFEGIRKNQLYILPDPSWKGIISQRFRDLIAECNPSSTKALTDFLGDKQAMTKLVTNFWGEKIQATISKLRGK